MDTDLNNEFNLAVDRLSQYVSTQSPNVDFVRRTRGRGCRNVSSVIISGRSGSRGRCRFGYGQGEVGRFGYGRGRGGRGVRGGGGGYGGGGGGRGGRGNRNSYNNNERQNYNHGVDTSDIMRNFTPEEASALIQANVWDDINGEQRTNRRRINSNHNSDITERVNDLG